MDSHAKSNVVSIIKTLYLYLVSFVALFMIAFSVADMLNIALRTFIFTKADNYYYGPYVQDPACETPTTPGATSTPQKPGYCVSPEEQKRRDDESRSAQRQRDLVRDISFLLVGSPLFVYHWRLARRKDTI